MNINDTIGVGKKVLEAFVLAKTGNVKRAGRLFAEAANDESIDPLMDGLAKSIQSLEAQDEEVDVSEEIESEDEEIEPEDEEIEEEAKIKSSANKSKKTKIKAEDDEEDDEEEEEVKPEEGEGVEIPASVAEVLKLEY